MQIKTTRCSSLMVEQEKIIAFPYGIPGFEELKRFILLPEEDIEAFHWLQSVDEPAVAFLVVDPFIFFPDYCFELPDEEIKTLDIQSSEEVLVVNIISIPRDQVAETTANLVGPIVINTKLKQAKQVILTCTSYSTKHLLFAGAAKRKTGNAQGKGEATC